MPHPRYRAFSRFITPVQILADCLIHARQLARRPLSRFSVIHRPLHFRAQQVRQLARIHLVILATLL